VLTEAADRARATAARGQRGRPATPLARPYRRAAATAGPPASYRRVGRLHNGARSRAARGWALLPPVRQPPALRRSRRAGPSADVAPFGGRRLAAEAPSATPASAPRSNTPALAAATMCRGTLRRCADALLGRALARRPPTRWPAAQPRSCSRVAAARRQPRGCMADGLRSIPCATAASPLIAPGARFTISLFGRAFCLRTAFRAPCGRPTRENRNAPWEERMQPLAWPILAHQHGPRQVDAR
jgi:hypothetical protein